MGTKIKSFPAPKPRHWTNSCTLFFQAITVRVKFGMVQIHPLLDSMPGHEDVGTVRFDLPLNATPGQEVCNNVQYNFIYL